MKAHLGGVTVAIELSNDALVAILYLIQTFIFLALYFVVKSRLTLMASIVVELGKRFGGGTAKASLNWKSIAAEAMAPMLPQLIERFLGGGGRDGKPPG